MMSIFYYYYYSRLFALTYDSLPLYKIKMGHYGVQCVGTRNGIRSPPLLSMADKPDPNTIKQSFFSQ